MDASSVGPAFKEIAARYHGKPGVSNQLADKIIKGGSGNWGTREMMGHPEMSQTDAKKIADYILALNDQKAKLPLHGKFQLKEHIGKPNDGSYLIMAEYKDNGANNIEPLTGKQFYILRNPLVQIEDFDSGNLRIGTITTAFISYARTKHKGYTKFNRLDLAHVSKLKYRIQSNGPGGMIELHLDSISGPLVSSVTIPPGEVKNLKTNWKDIIAPVKKMPGIHDLYFVFVNPAEPQKNLFNIDWIYFIKE